MKNYLVRHLIQLLVTLTLLAAANTAFAVTAEIDGTYSSYKSGKHFEVALGQLIEISGNCHAAIMEIPSGSYWTVGDNEPAYYKRSGSETYHAFIVEGREGSEFNVNLLCKTTTLYRRDDTANRTFYIVDKTAPTATWDNPPTYVRDSLTVTPHVTDGASAIGPVSLRWRIQGGAYSTRQISYETNAGPDLHYQTFSEVIDTSSMPEGKLEVEISTVDAKNNASGWVALGSTIVDHYAPTLGAASISQSGELATVSIPVSDSASGVKTVWIRWQEGSKWSSDTIMSKNGSSGEYAYAINTHGLPYGSQPIQIWARDNAGNDTNWVAKGGFSIAHPAPSIAWDKSNAKFASTKMLVRAQVKATAGFSAAQAWIWWKGAPNSGYRMKEEGGGTYSYTIPTAGLPDGVAQSVMFWAKDNDGTVRDWITPAGSSFTVDRTPPAITLQSAPNDKVLRNDLAFALNITDTGSQLDPAYPPQICWVQKNTDGSWPDCTHPENLHPRGVDYLFTIPVAKLHDGEIKVMFNAQDKLGNSHLLSNGAWPDGPRFIIDKTRPVIDWQMPIDNVALTGASVHIVGKVIDDNPDRAIIKWQAENDTAWHSHTVQISKDNAFEYNLSGLVQGVNYRIRMQATDKAGNVSEMTPVRNVIGQLAANTLFRNPLFFIADESVVDKDDSGGFSRDDDVIYTLALETGKYAALNASLQYTLPAGLVMTPGTKPYFAPDNDIGDDAKLNAHWNGVSDTQLLADHANLKANGKLLIHIPVTLTAQSSVISPVVSTVRAGAKNAKDELTLTYALALQAKFPAHRALALELTSLQPNWKYAQGTLFDYRIAVHVLDWDLNAFTLDYALPPGLEKHGEARIEDAGTSASDSTFTSALALNPAWGKNGVKLLLSSTPGAVLAARHSFAVIIPVMVRPTAAGSVLRSEVEANAGNLSGPVSAMHRIVVDGSGGDPEDQLVLKKTVDKKTALPGQTLRYTITYSNVGIDDLHDLVIRDTIQDEYLTLQGAQCGSIIPRTIKCRAVPLGHGALEWRLDGKLEAGDSGSVEYEVRINENA